MPPTDFRRGRISPGVEQYASAVRCNQGSVADKLDGIAVALLGVQENRFAGDVEAGPMSGVEAAILREAVGPASATRIP